MTSIKVKLGSVVATSAFVLSIVPNVFAASNVDVTVTGNGVGSNNEVVVKDVSTEVVKQSNTTNVVNIQSANSSTGGNSIVGTTGEGDQSIETGNAKAVNKLDVVGGSNTIVTDDCGCDPTTTTVDVSGNGVDSDTKVKVISKAKKITKQTTKTNVINAQEANAKTGKNKIKNSTGTDGNSIVTGKATTKNKAVVESGSNVIGPLDMF